MGLFLIVPMPGRISSAQIHLCFLPSAWGQVEEAGRQFLAWVWRETSLQTLEGPVPTYNPQALRVAKACGFTEDHMEQDAGTRHGQPYDLIITKCERPQ